MTVDRIQPDPPKVLIIITMGNKVVMPPETQGPRPNLTRHNSDSSRQKPTRGRYVTIVDLADLVSVVAMVGVVGLASVGEI